MSNSAGDESETGPTTSELIDDITQECGDCGATLYNSHAVRAHSCTPPTFTPDSENYQRLVDWLEETVVDAPITFKAKHIDGEIDLPPKEIGRCMGHVDRSNGDFNVERPGSKNTTIWRVSRSEGDGGDCDE